MAYKLEKLFWELPLDNECNELTVEKNLEVVEDLYDLKCEYVYLTGQNILERKDIGIITSALHSAQIKFSIICQFEYITVKTIQLLRLLHPDKVILKINYISDKEILEKSIELLKKYKFDVMAFTKLDASNFQELEEVRSFLVKNKISKWHINYVTCNEKNIISEKQFELFSKFFIETKEKYTSYFDDVISIPRVGYFDEISEKIYKEKWFGCPAGMTMAAISKKGNIKGCLYLDDNIYCEGNICNNSFKEIWLSKNKYIYNRRFDINSIDNACKKCLYVPVCKGGCIANSICTTKRATKHCLFRLEQN